MHQIIRKNYYTLAKVSLYLSAKEYPFNVHVLGRKRQRCKTVTSAETLLQSKPNVCSGEISSILENQFEIGLKQSVLEVANSYPNYIKMCQKKNFEKRLASLHYGE